MINLCWFLIFLGLDLAVVSAGSDSRLRISITYPYGEMKSEGAFVRLFDRETDKTYHQISNPILVDTLAALWDPESQPGKCGKAALSVHENFTRVCDPEDFIPTSIGNQLRAISYNIPRVTGCQCDSFQHCNHYESGFSLFIVVVPTVMQSSYTNSSYYYGLLPFLSDEQLGAHATTSVEPVNFSIPKLQNDQKFEILPKNANVYELVAHLLRVLWSTGSCDEDMEKRLSMSVGGQLLKKVKRRCLDAAFAEATKQMMGKPSVALSPEAYEERKMVLEDLDRYEKQANEGSMSRAATFAKRHRAEVLRLSAILLDFVENVNSFVQSRSEDPCLHIAVRKWSQIQISSFAVMTGIGLSVMLALMLRFCGLLSDFIDRFIVEEPSAIERRQWRYPEVLPRTNYFPNADVAKARSARSEQSLNENMKTPLPMEVEPKPLYFKENNPILQGNIPAQYDIRPTTV